MGASLEETLPSRTIVVNAEGDQLGNWANIHHFSTEDAFDRADR